MVYTNDKVLPYCDNLKLSYTIAKFSVQSEM